MTLFALRDDALCTADDGFTLRLGLPWIRSLPLASLVELAVTVDDEPVDQLVIAIDGRLIEASDLTDETGWWFLQHRLSLHGRLALSPGAHDVVVSFRLVVPYLQISPNGPLVLPFRIARSLTPDAVVPAPAVVTETAAGHLVDTVDGRVLPAKWTLAASAFNWTPEVIRAERDAPSIAVGIVEDGVAAMIEVEPGQLWRSFPRYAPADLDAFRTELESVGGGITIVGGSLDDWASLSRRRTEAERLDFLLPQLQTAARLGAGGIRLPIGQAGEPLLRQLLPALHELDLVLYEEAQGQQSPSSPAAASAIDAIARIDDSHIRLLVDISMFMPALPPSYLEELRSGGVLETLLTRLENDWRDPATHGAVIDLLRSGVVPPQVHTLFMNLLVRFGRSDVAELPSVLPLVGAFHLKFWDLDDSDGRVSAPIRELGALLSTSDFSGSLCSEWGGHEWLDDDPSTITRDHRRLARAALMHGATSAHRSGV